MDITGQRYQSLQMIHIYATCSTMNAGSCFVSFTIPYFMLDNTSHGLYYNVKHFMVLPLNQT